MTVIENGTVLVAVSEYGEFASLVTLCREVEAKLGLHPVFVFAPGYGLVSDHARMVEFENWSWTQLGGKTHSYRTELDEESSNGYFRVFSDVALSDSPVIPITPAQWKSKLLYLGVAIYQLLSFVKRKILRMGLRQAGGAVPLFLPLRQLKKMLVHAEHIYQEVRPRLVLSGQDYALSVTSLLSIVGERKGIKTSIVPFNMPPTTREIIESFAYSGYNRLQGIEKRLAQMINPKWLNVRRGQVYCRVKLLTAIAADTLGLTPAEPWLPNSGKAIVFVPSQWSYDYYLTAGIPQNQLRLTGSEWSDTLVQARGSISERRIRLVESILNHSRRKQSSKKCSSQAKQRIIIISWPPNQYPRHALGCATYMDLCRQFITSIHAIQAADIANVVVSLHPTLTDQKLLARIQDAGIYVLRSNLIEYVDCADLFVSTVSSTSFWALQCGIPTINFDGYMYGYTEFDQAGAITIKTPSELFTVCKNLLENPEQFASVRLRIAERSSLFAETGGINKQRIMNGLAELVAAADHATSPLSVATDAGATLTVQTVSTSLDGQDAA